MHGRTLIPLLITLGLAAAACETPQEQPEPVPPGVSVDPPRAAPEAGSITLPGVEPEAPIEAAAPPAEAEEDTVVEQQLEDGTEQ
jgi:hypothetical protein